MDRCTAQRDDRHGPLRSRWYREQEMWGAQQNVKRHFPWCGDAPYRGAKGGGRICFGVGKGPTDLSCNEVKRQLRSSYHVPIPVPTPFQGRYSKDYVLRSNETLRGPPSPLSSPRRSASTPQEFPTLAWKHETWGQTASGPAPFQHTLRMSPSGEGLAPMHDIMQTGLASRVRTAPRSTFTAKRPLASPDRASMRLNKWETRRSNGTRRLAAIPSASQRDGWA